MSGAAENRWSRGGPQQQRQNRQQGNNAAQDRSGTNTPHRQDSNRQSVSSNHTNAWGNQDRGARAGPGDRRSTPTPAGQQANDRSKSNAATGQGYAPINGFNSKEVKEFLSKTYKDAINTGAGNPHVTVQGDSVPKRSSGVWQQNKQIDAKNMANGQNFWSQLSLQVQRAGQGK